MSISIPVKLDLVIVTFNRLEKLKKALSCYEKQTSPFRNLILVNNCSTDGTKEYIDEWQQEKTFFGKIVIHTDENLGGSGGFYLGQKKALELGADWVFVADDDAYAESDMVEKFYDFVENINSSDISSISTTVLNSDRSIDFSHRSRINVKGFKFDIIPSSIADYKQNSFSIDAFSYVGCFLNSKKLKMVGLVNKDFFIYSDDCEHSIRIEKVGKNICVPAMRMVHDSGEKTAKWESCNLTWRDYYMTRNQLYMLKCHYKRAMIKQIYHTVKRILHRKSPAERIMLKDAMFDAIMGKLGVHSIYRPGYTIS